MGEWRYSSTILDLSTRWELSRQLHAPAALPPGKETLVLVWRLKPKLAERKNLRWQMCSVFALSTNAAKVLSRVLD
jgi:hypothetical protein